jgi:amidohydrolase
MSDAVINGIPAAMAADKARTEGESGASPDAESPLVHLSRAIDEHGDFLVKTRRQIHANPEASGQERATTALVAQTLRERGLQPTIMRDGVGMVVDVDLGAPSDSYVAIRAELDCVKVDDEKSVAYASTNPGRCHACGHDAHTTIALGATLAIHDSRSRFRALGPKHNLRAIFQPAEENATGALSMIDQGALNDVRAILAVHVEPFLETGVIGLRKGALTSACTAFEVHIKGRSGHSARPFESIDPIPAATNIVSLFHQLCPRSMDSRHPLALTVTSISSGDSFNVIPDDATLKGTLRAARPQDVEAVKSKMADVVKGVSQATGCDIALTFPFHAPPTNNDSRLIDIMAEAAAHLAPGMPGVVWIEVPSLGAEDFAFYQQEIPGAIVRLGAAVPDKSKRVPLHSSHFDIDERALTIGAKFLARSALMAAATI